MKCSNGAGGGLGFFIHFFKNFIIVQHLFINSIAFSMNFLIFLGIFFKRIFCRLYQRVLMPGVR